MPLGYGQLTPAFWCALFFLQLPSGYPAVGPTLPCGREGKVNANRNEGI